MSEAALREYEAIVDAAAKAAAEAAGFCWEHCAQEQWRREVRAGLMAAQDALNRGRGQ